jgi:preprotein translocase subunit SecG
MIILITVVHVIACVILVLVVLLQAGKGADMGAVFGGGSQTLFGSGGAGNFLTRLTTGTAIAFMMTSLILTWGASRTPGSGLLRRLPAAEERSEAQPPATADAGAPAPEPTAGEEAAAPTATGELPAAPPAAAPKTPPAEQPPAQ